VAGSQRGREAPRLLGKRPFVSAGVLAVAADADAARKLAELALARLSK
jgi:hypothetical protein